MPEPTVWNATIAVLQMAAVTCVISLLVVGLIKGVYAAVRYLNNRGGTAP